MAAKIDKEVVDLSKQHSLISAYVAELRDITIQNDPMRFRRNLERIAEIAAYEISKELEWQDKEIQTPLTTTTVKELAQQPVVASILRAGLPMHQGLLNYFDRAENAFISAYRKHDDEGHFFIQLEYMACPDITGKTLMLTDPMLATGASMVLTLQQILKIYKPSAIHLVSAIACAPGIKHVHENLPQVKIWAGAIDMELNEKSYIVPGLGDAGDLAFGVKMQY